VMSGGGRGGAIHLFSRMAGKKGRKKVKLKEEMETMKKDWRGFSECRGQPRRYYKGDA